LPQFGAFLIPKSAEKCKKYKKNAKKVQNNLHISKKSSTFAPKLKNKTGRQPETAAKRI